MNRASRAKQTAQACETGSSSPAPALSYASPGTVQIDWTPLFATPAEAPLTRFLTGVFQHKSVDAVDLDPAKGRAQILFQGRNGNVQAALPQVARALAQANVDPGSESTPLRTFAAWAASGKHCRITRYGHRYSTWEILHALPGRVRLYNPLIRRRRDLCRVIEQELMATLGVDRFTTTQLRGTVLIHFNPRHLKTEDLIRLLDGVLLTLDQEASDTPDPDFAICTTSLAVAAASQFAVPALYPVGTALFLYASLPSYQGAWDLLVKERRLGVDILDAVVISLCLASGEIFAGALMSWCLGLGRKLLKKTQDDSRHMLLDIFGKQPRVVCVLRDAVETEIPLEELSRQDTVVVKTGEVVPVDGIIREGFGMLDQHALTGEATPAEKGVGERVFASTVMLAGQVHLAVEKTGGETTAAQITRILNDTLDYKLLALSRGETLADRAVAPTLALGSLAAASIGMNGAMAVVNCDLGTGIRIAAPLALLASLNLCARQGILVKEGRALETLPRVDTILFDKTGTLTRERPEVGKVFTWNGLDEGRIVQYAAAAEHKFTHPIALAVQEKFRQMGLAMPPTDASRYHVGYGITVSVDGRPVRVGSRRFLEREGIAIPPAAQGELERIHTGGHSFILVAVDETLAGALELQASQRPEVQEIIEGLRARGIAHMAILSGDHEEPTRRLADTLGMDRYFAGVLPQDKARYVELLQSEGRTVCFIGDGINDSIALKQADVSISLRGASTVAVDMAQIVFMQEGLRGLCSLFDIARGLERNVNRSWKLILVPNSLCILGVFTLGFGLWHSVVFNEVSILLSFLNGVLPFRKVADLQADRELEMELVLANGNGKAL